MSETNETPEGGECQEEIPEGNSSKDETDDHQPSTSFSSSENKSKRAKAKDSRDNATGEEACEVDSDSDSKRQRLSPTASDSPPPSPPLSRHFNSSSRDSLFDDDNSDRLTSSPSSSSGSASSDMENYFGIHRNVMNSDDGSSSDDELREHPTPAVLQKPRPKTNWNFLPEIATQQLGCNATFHKKFYGSLYAAEKLVHLYSLTGHSGCVNALNFNTSGRLICSGSDDLNLIVWDWSTTTKKEVFVVGHTSNILQVKWLPFTQETKIVTSARDGQVRLLDTVNGKTRRLAKHDGPSHKIAVQTENPELILSIGEDAKVLAIDTRVKKPSLLLTVKDSTFNPTAQVDLYTVAYNPRNSHEFCVGGQSPTVQVFDRRNVEEAVNILRPDHLKNNKYAHVTCAVYNWDGTEILASYNDEDIYLFDRDCKPGTFAHRYQGHRNNATVKGVSYYGPKSEFIVSGSDCGNIFIWDKNTESIVKWMHGDEQGVVNCLEPHPCFPVMATSGLDYDVKIWIPSETEENGNVNGMEGLERCVKSNMKKREESIHDNDTFSHEMMYILLPLALRSGPQHWPFE